MRQNQSEYLFVLEIANNHMGDVNHGLKIIKEFSKVCKKYPFSFAFKLQYRNLDTYIHPDMQNRMDLKYIKRFSETKVSNEVFDLFVKEIRAQGHLAIATPFDEVSVETIVRQNLDYIKIASCSFTDWPLLEKISQYQLPVIASTAGASLDEIDRVVSFFTHRQKNLSILHCIGEYPTPDELAHLSQIDLLKSRYPNIRIGYSTHENPSNLDNIKIALAKGARIFEKHIGLPTEKYSVNEYSATPDQIDSWLSSAQRTIVLSGTSKNDHFVSKKERESLLSLKRGVFAKKEILAGEKINHDNVFFAFPCTEGQITSNDWSKYIQYTTSVNIPKNAALNLSNTNRTDIREMVWDIAQKVKLLLRESHVVLPGRMEMEISHHYGIENFYKTGITMLTVVNRSYCKKLIVVLPGQNHPEQYHKQKDETFHVLFGEIELSLDGQKRNLIPGDIVNVLPGVRHAFNSKNGAVIEELSSTHIKDDSYYSDESISKNKNRKTLLSYWMD